MKILKLIWLTIYTVSVEVLSEHEEVQDKLVQVMKNKYVVFFYIEPSLNYHLSLDYYKNYSGL